MRSYRFWPMLALVIVGFLSPRVTLADSLSIGQLSLDDVGTGNAFDLYNLTDGLNGFDDIADNDLFSGSLSVNIQGIGTQVFNYSGIDSVPHGGGLSDHRCAALLLRYSVGYPDVDAGQRSTSVNISDDLGNPVVANLLTVSNISLPPLVVGQNPDSDADANADPML